MQTVNADTPYSRAVLDLRSEPIVLRLPKIARNRYFTMQFVDMYTHNFAYVGSRTTGNDGGSFLITGPGWKGAALKGIKAVIPCETELMTLIGRTQLFNPADLPNVKKIQADYRLQPLSQFLKQPAPPAAPPVDVAALKDTIQARDKEWSAAYLAGDAAGIAIWDLRNRDGRDAASGVYFTLMDGDGGPRTLKVAVQR